MQIKTNDKNSNKDKELEEIWVRLCKSLSFESRTLLKDFFNKLNESS